MIGRILKPVADELNPGTAALESTKVNRNPVNDLAFIVDVACYDTSIVVLRPAKGAFNTSPMPCPPVNVMPRLFYQFVLISILLTGCQVSETPESSDVTTTVKEESPAYSAQLEQVTPCRWPTVVRSQGSLMADEIAVIGAKLAGRVVETHVDLGSRVSAGEVLARLQSQEFELGVQQAEAQLAEACAVIGLKPEDSIEKLDPESVPSVLVAEAIWQESRDSLTRTEQLRKSNAISKSEYERQLAAERVASAKYQSALSGVAEKIALIRVRRAALAMAQQDLQDAVIRAPFAGVVQQRHVTEGVIVNEGMPLVTLVRTDPLRYRGRVPERKAFAVREGQPLNIKVEGYPDLLVSEVKRTSPSLDEANRSLMIEGEIENPKGLLRSGVFAEAEIVVDADATTLAVPMAAVGEFAGVYRVWLVTDGVAGQQQVQIGRRSAQQVEILSGLEAEQWVIANFDQGIVGRVEATVKNQLTSHQP